MRQMVFGQRERFVPWAAARMPFENFGGFPADATAIAVVDEEEVLAVAVYHHYYPQFKDISMSIAAASPRWASKEVFGTMLGFPFLQLGCARVTTWQPEGHKIAHKLVKGVGFKVEGIKRKGFGDKDTVMLGLMREEAEPWLRFCQLPAYDLSVKEQTDG